jgi:hypothetical protein
MSYFPVFVSGICGLLLILLVGALIINTSFRGDVLGGEGEATVLGLLSIKGVAIVLLCGLFLGGFIYPLKYFTEPSTEPSSDEIEDIIRVGLENRDTEGAYTGSLMNMIENLPPSSLLGKKLVELAEARHSPFNFSSRPVKLSLGSNIPQGFVGVCEHSDFIKKNIVVFILGDNNEMLHKISLFADLNYAFPCSGDLEMLLINVQDISKPNKSKSFAKRTL